MSVSPPRTSGFSTARTKTRSALSSGDGELVFVGALSGRGGRRASGGGQRRFVIGMVRHFLHILGMAHLLSRSITKIARLSMRSSLISVP